MHATTGRIVARSRVLSVASGDPMAYAPGASVTSNRLLTFFCFDRYISEGDDAGAISEEDDDDDAEEEVEVEEEDEAETAPRE
jgi:hypothetical protein